MSEEKVQDHEIKKISVVYRVLCSFVLLVSSVGIIGVIAAIIYEPFHYISLIALFVCAVMSHISGTIAFTGYAPSYLLFAHGNVNLNEP